MRKRKTLRQRVESLRKGGKSAKKEQANIRLRWAKLHVNPLAGGDLHCVGPVVLTHLPGSKSRGRPIDPNAADYSG